MADISLTTNSSEDLMDQLDMFCSDNGNNSPVHLMNNSCIYYEIEELHSLIKQEFKFNAMHLNIQSLPSKFDQLRIFISRLEDIGAQLDYILLSETFLNEHKFRLTLRSCVKFVSKC